MSRATLAMVIMACGLVLAGVGLVGCAGTTTDLFGTYKVDKKHYTIDGKTYRCFLIRTHKGTASLSCDWDHPL